MVVLITTTLNAAVIITVIDMYSLSRSAVPSVISVETEHLRHVTCVLMTRRFRECVCA